MHLIFKLATFKKSYVQGFGRELSVDSEQNKLKNNKYRFFRNVITMYATFSELINRRDKLTNNVLITT